MAQIENSFWVYARSFAKRFKAQQVFWLNGRPGVDQNKTMIFIYLFRWIFE